MSHHHLLQVGWYNSVLPPSLHLSYPNDSLAVVVLSTPDMFEQAFLPFLMQRGCKDLSDPIDQCVRHCVTSAVSQVRVEKCGDGGGHTDDDSEFFCGFFCYYLVITIIIKLCKMS